MDQNKLKRARACLAVARTSLATVAGTAELYGRLQAINRDLETTHTLTTCEQLADIVSALEGRKSAQPGRTPTGQRFKQDPTAVLPPAVDGAIGSVEKARKVLGCKRRNASGS